MIVTNPNQLLVENKTDFVQTITILNKSDNPVLFKIKSTNPKLFKLKPITGYLKTEPV